jgi:biopolymer transport protein ExbB
MQSIHRLRAFAAALLIAASAIFPAVVLADTPAAAPTESTAPAAVEVKDTVDNPYGLDALWKGGDIVAKATLTILVIMSVGSWFIIVSKLIEQQKLIKQGDKANETFWSAGELEQAVATLDEESAYHFIAKAGFDAKANHRGLLGYIDFNDWILLSIQRSLEKVQSRLQTGLAFLATVGSTAPFVGLFGTVWGIYHALTAIGIAGQASIDKVAGPVGESLIMTAIGLAVAVPAVLGYNWLVRRNKAALENVRTFGAELHAVLLGSAAERSSDKAARPANVIRAISV